MKVIDLKAKCLFSLVLIGLTGVSFLAFAQEKPIPVTAGITFKKAETLFKKETNDTHMTNVLGRWRMVLQMSRPEAQAALNIIDVFSPYGLINDDDSSHRVLEFTRMESNWDRARYDLKGSVKIKNISHRFEHQGPYEVYEKGDSLRFSEDQEEYLDGGNGGSYRYDCRLIDQRQLTKVREAMGLAPSVPPMLLCAASPQNKKADWIKDKKDKEDRVYDQTRFLNKVVLYYGYVPMD